MKSLALSPFFLFIFIQITFSQSPQAFNYQAIARDSNGNPLINQAVAFQVCILKGSATGFESYCETHNPTTNEFGLVSLLIGNGTVDYGQFDTISWGSDGYFLKISLDETNGTNFTWMGTTQLLAVPYALYADSSGKGDNLGNHVASQNIQTNGHWITKNGNNSGMKIIDSTDYGVSIQSTGSGKTLYVMSDNSSDSAIAIYGEHPDGPYGYIGGSGHGIYGSNKVTGNYGYIGGWSYPMAGYNPDHNSFGIIGYNQFGVYGENYNYGTSGVLGSAVGVSGYHESQTNGYIGGEHKAVYGVHPSGNKGYIASDTIGIYGYSGSDSQAIFGENENGNIGYIGSDSTGVYGFGILNSYGVVGENENGQFGYLGGNLYGVYGSTNLYTREAIYGDNTFENNYGYIGGDYGVFGKDNASNSYGSLGGNNIGVRGYTYSNTGCGVYGGHIDGNYGKIGIPDAGVGGFAYQEGYGVYGKNWETGNYGVLGHLSYGVYGVSSNGYAGYFEGKGFFSNWLGIGAAPQSMLDVEGEGTPNGGVTNYNEVVGRFRNNLAEHHTALALDAQDGNDALLYFSEDGAARWDIRTDVSEDEFLLVDNVLEFRYQKNNANDEVLKLYDGGTHYKIKTYGDLFSSAGNTFDCGTSAYYWNEVYANYFVDISDQKNNKNTAPLSVGLKEILGIQTFASETNNGGYDYQIDPISLDSQIPGIVVKPDNSEENTGIKTNELIPILIKAVQEQQAQIEELKAKIDAMD